MGFNANNYSGYGRGYGGIVPGFGTFGFGNLGGLGLIFGGLGAAAGIAGAVYGIRAAGFGRPGIGFGARPPFF